MKGLNHYSLLLSGEVCEGCSMLDKLGGNISGCYQPCCIADERIDLILFMESMSLDFDGFMALMEYTEVWDSIIFSVYEEEDENIKDIFEDLEADWWIEYYKENPMDLC
jgi:hypothetical protein